MQNYYFITLAKFGFIINIANSMMVSDGSLNESVDHFFSLFYFLL